MSSSASEADERVYAWRRNAESVGLQVRAAVDQQPRQDAALTAAGIEVASVCRTFPGELAQQRLSAHQGDAQRPSALAAFAEPPGPARQFLPCSAATAATNRRISPLPELASSLLGSCRRRAECVKPKRIRWSAKPATGTAPPQPTTRRWLRSGRAPGTGTISCLLHDVLDSRSTRCSIIPVV